MHLIAVVGADDTVYRDEDDKRIKRLSVVDLREERTRQKER